MTTGRLMHCPVISYHMALFMVRYGEIALKSPGVRMRFEKALGRNITSRFMKSGKECRIQLERGRIFLWSDDVDFAEDALTRTFGIVSYSRVTESTSSKEDIFRIAAEISKPCFKQGARFRATVRRNGQHPYTSMELAKEVGDAVFLANRHLDPKVDLSHPEVEICVDVRQNKSYIYTGSHPGPGGMPLGTQGRVLGILEKSRDADACWLMMKRGCRVFILTDNAGLAEPLKAWDQNLKVLPLENRDLSKFARSRRAEGLCLGWDAAEFDSKGNEMAGYGMPVFLPLIGMDAAEVEMLTERIRGRNPHLTAL